MTLAEAHHHHKFGHFVGYGLHTDVVLGNSDIGTNDMYFAQLLNLSVLTAHLEGCRLPGGFAWEGILYRWDVQKWSLSTQSWNSLRGADSWVPTPFGGYSNDEKCLPEITHIRPFTARKVAWVFDSWVTTGDPVRIAIHTSATAPPDKQRILYTGIFVVRMPSNKTFQPQLPKHRHYTHNAGYECKRLVAAVHLEPANATFPNPQSD